jgi:single-strand DNA-binding protein
MLKLELIGNLGQDAVVNNVNGKTVVNFSVAITEKWKGVGGEPMEKTYWVSCAYWAEKTKVAEYLKKGTSVFLEGTPEASLYTNKQGQTIPQLKVRVSYLKLLSKGNSGGTQQQNENANDITEPIENLPF